jgi:hypothetical protein
MSQYETGAPHLQGAGPRSIAECGGRGYQYRRFRTETPTLDDS